MPLTLLPDRFNVTWNVPWKAGCLVSFHLPVQSPAIRLAGDGVPGAVDGVGAGVGAAVGASVGADDGVAAPVAEGDGEGVTEGVADGDDAGMGLGVAGDAVSDGLGRDGAAVGPVGAVQAAASNRTTMVGMRSNARTRT